MTEQEFPWHLTLIVAGAPKTVDESWDAAGKRALTQQWANAAPEDVLTLVENHETTLVVRARDVMGMYWARGQD